MVKALDWTAENWGSSPSYALFSSPSPPFLFLSVFASYAFYSCFFLTMHAFGFHIYFEALGAHWLSLGCATQGGKVAGRKLESFKNSNLYQV